MGKTIIYSLAFIALGLSSASLGPTLPALAAQTHVEMSQISHLFVFRSLGTMIGSWLIGRCYDRLAGHPLLALSLVVSAVAMLLVPVVKLLWLMSMVFLFLGMASGSINVGGNTLIVQVHGERVRPFISTLHFAFGAGGLLAPVLVALFADQSDSLQLTYCMLALLGILPAVFVWLSASPRSARHRHPGKDAKVPALIVFTLVFFFFLEVGGEAGLMGWIFTYSTARGMDNQTAAYITSAFWAAFSVGRLATIWLAMRFSAPPLIVAHLSIWLILAGSDC